MNLIEIIKQYFTKECEAKNKALQLIITQYDVAEKYRVEELVKLRKSVEQYENLIKEDGEAIEWNSKWPTANIKYKCRYVPNKSTFFEIDVKSFITINSAILKDIVHNFNLKGDTYDKTAYNCLNWVIRWIKYSSDIKEQKVNEFWEFPFETYGLKKGDCEDGGILLISLMGAAGIPAYKRKMCAGNVKTNKGKVGHAYAIYLRADGQWIPLDWCYWSKKNKPLNEFTIHSQDEHYEDIWFTWNEEFAWRQSNFIIKGDKLK